MDKLSLDYDDLIAFTRHILHNFPDARTKWQEQLSYVMVDEAQDCNAGEWDIIETLSKVSGNLFVVGDPDQSIYEWRGARPDVFLRFDSERDIVLDQNYRSTANILGVANSIIGNNRIRLEKNMFTREGDGDSIIHFHAADVAAEHVVADQVVDVFVRKLGDGLVVAVVHVFLLLFGGSGTVFSH